MTSEKRCFKCGEVRSLDQFYRHPRMGDGHLNKCKDCARADVRANRIERIDYYRDYDRSRSGRDDRVALRAKTTREYRDRFPDRYAAYTAVSNAVRDGRLKKQPCAFCGSDDELHAHHHDYSKPLDVTWLCVPCHRRFHALEQMATYERAAIAAA